MRKTFFLSFAGNAAAVHATRSAAGEAVRQKLLTAAPYDAVVVIYCCRTSYKYAVTFEVTQTYVIVYRPPLTVFLNKTALSSEDCQSHLYNVVRAALEV